MHLLQFALKGYSIYALRMQGHCIMVGKLVVQIYQLVSFLKFVEYLNCSYCVPTFYEESF